MIISDFIFIFQWWAMFFVIGLIFLPLTTRIFNNFFDRGYIFSKTLGILLISYSVWLLGSLKILPFTESTIISITIIFLLLNILLISKYPNILISLKHSRRIFLLEEIIFLTALFFWSYVRAHEPSIHGLEKFMDFGFINSILRADYFPPRDIWLTPLPINYYYFGHLITAVLTKLSGIDSTIAYNLMLATLFALTFTGAFSLGANLFRFSTIAGDAKARGGPLIGGSTPALFSGFLTAFLVSLSGNLQTIYSFFKGFLADNPQPPWQLIFSPGTFPNSYWYPNATRFIPFTIHEFPSYSFVVADLHSHLLNVPVVLLTIAILFSTISKFEYRNPKQSKIIKIQNLKQGTSFGHLILKNLNLFRNWSLEFRILLLLSFLIAVMYMTNAWDGIIYAGLAFIIFLYLGYRAKNSILHATYYLLLIIGGIIFTLPFTLNFEPFVSGIGLICAPDFLTKIGKIGPFLFEENHCARSPFWQLLILYGFFYFFVVGFLIFLRKTMKQFNNLTISDVFILLLVGLSTFLIIIPEFIYLKDIYPAHYRANTMFKLTYQAFILLSISSGYIIPRIVFSIKYHVLRMTMKKKILNTFYIILATSLFLLVAIYPYFAVTSYYNNFKVYSGLDGLSYLKNLYPEDYEAILWLRKNIQGPPVGEASQPVILEAHGESYSDFTRVSANTGLPTVFGWPVHEWLWRGSPNFSSPRVGEVQLLYETTDINLAQTLLKKYNISLIFIGELERQKYQVFEEKFEKLGKVIFQSGQTKIYRIGG